MSSRREKKEALRRAREAAAAAAAAKERRRRLAVYAVGGVLGLGALAAVGGVLLSDGGGDGGTGGAAVYPDGGEVPAPKVTDFEEAASAAGCELRTVKIKSREHVPGKVNYPSKPPAGGDHLEVAAEDGVYEDRRRRSLWSTR